MHAFLRIHLLWWRLLLQKNQLLWFLTSLNFTYIWGSLMEHILHGGYSMKWSRFILFQIQVWVDIERKRQPGNHTYPKSYGEIRMEWNSIENRRKKRTLHHISTIMSDVEIPQAVWHLTQWWKNSYDHKEISIHSSASIPSFSQQ